MKVNYKSYTISGYINQPNNCVHSLHTSATYNITTSQQLNNSRYREVPAAPVDPAAASRLNTIMSRGKERGGGESDPINEGANVAKWCVRTRGYEWRRVSSLWRSLDTTRFHCWETQMPLNEYGHHDPCDVQRSQMFANSISVRQLEDTDSFRCYSSQNPTACLNPPQVPWISPVWVPLLLAAKHNRSNLEAGQATKTVLLVASTGIKLLIGRHFVIGKLQVRLVSF